MASHLISRWVTLGLVGIGLLTFLLPWTRISILGIQFVTQSGFQTAIGSGSIDSRFESEIKLSEAQRAVELRRQGKNPQTEDLKEQLRAAAPQVLIFPTVLGVAGLIAISTPRPTASTFWTVTGLAGAALLFVLIQYGIVGHPIERELQREAVGKGEHGLFVLWLTEYKVGTGLVLGVVSAIGLAITQGVFLLTRQWSR